MAGYRTGNKYIELAENRITTYRLWLPGALALFSFLAILLTSSTAHAVEKIRVMALFTDKALVMIDGNKQLLTKNKPSEEGVKLISANSEYVVLEIDGESKRYPLGREIAASYKGPEKGQPYDIWQDQTGMFRTFGSINNFSVTFLVDTGATTVALNSGDAQRMGIDYKKGAVTQAATASGVTNAYQVNLNKVKVGHIELYNVQGLVIPGSFPNEVLLGQSFLSRLQMVREGNKMSLSKKY